MNSPLRIVYLEDDPADVRLVRDTFNDDGLCLELTAVDNREDFLAALEQCPDLILADYALPTFDGMEALALCRALCPERPFIFLTGAIGEERAIETIKNGATDYVLKTALYRLSLAVRRALAEADDIAQRKHAEEAKNRFLANISHDLRTPMNCILGMIDIALSKVNDAIVQDCLQTAKGSADLLLTLLNDLLDSAKIESGKLELESAPFSLRSALDQITRVLAVRASEKGLCFYCRMPEATPDAVQGDRMRLQQVLLNLAGNAIKFTESGEVEISLRVVEEERLATRDEELGMKEGEDPSAATESSSLSLIPDPSPLSHPSSLIPHPCPPSVSLEFSVRDTGIGIPSSGLEQIFQPFTQGDASMARRFGGTGLGLSICKSLVQMMGGQIGVESEPGTGSTFYFTIRLPLAKEVPAGDAPAAVPKANCSPLRILLVEDNLANQKVANYILQDRGHHVEIAGDGNAAIRLTEQERYDVILMDVQMPEMNGLEAAAAIRHRENGRRRVPIVAMTAHAMQSDRERCLAAGMDGYLCKPVQRQELIETVERMGLGIKDEGMGMSDEGMMRDEGIRMSDEGSAMQEAGIRTHPSSLIAHPSSLAPHRASLPFDLDAALALFDGRIELFNDMVGFFFSDGMKVLPEIRAAAAASDAKTVEKKAHRLKGTVLYLGAKAAVESLARVESLGRSRDLAQAAAAIASMEEEITRLATALRPYE